MPTPNKNLDVWAKRALREFLRRCFHTCATTLEWDAAALKKVAEDMK